MGPGVWKSKRPLSTCHIRRECSRESFYSWCILLWCVELKFQMSKHQLQLPYITRFSFLNITIPRFVSAWATTTISVGLTAFIVIMAVVCTLLAMLLLSTDEAKVLPLKEEPEVKNLPDDSNDTQTFSKTMIRNFEKENKKSPRYRESNIDL